MLKAPQAARKNVVLWGLGQGCAMSLIADLMWDGKPFGALVSVDHISLQ